MKRVVVSSALVAVALLVACSSGPPAAGGGNTPSDGNDDSLGDFNTGDGAGDGTGEEIIPCVPNPKNYDVPGNHCDDDADGTVDNPPTCDASLTANGTAEEFARAMGICTLASEKGYGLVSAAFTRGYGRNDAPMAAQHGVLSKFGDVLRPREGSKLGVLSTGYAQEYNGSANAPFGGVVGSGNNKMFYGKDWYNLGLLNENTVANGAAPPGFPKAAEGCKQDSRVNDVVNLKLTLKAPPNAGGIKFDFNFLSGEWPAYICSVFNDGFIAYLTAKGFNGGKGDNISVDKAKNPVSVNAGFFDRCTPSTATGCAFESTKTGTSACPNGVSELAGTGFGQSGAWCKPWTGSNAQSTNGGATGWLTSQAPIEAGETFTLELMIWDTGDALLDSSVLVDNFSWAAGKVVTGTDRPVK